MPNYQFVPINDLRPGDEIASNNGAEVMRVIEVTPGGERPSGALGLKSTEKPITHVVVKDLCEFLESCGFEKCMTRDQNLRAWCESTPICVFISDEDMAQGLSGKSRNKYEGLKKRGVIHPEDMDLLFFGLALEGRILPGDYMIHLIPDWRTSVVRSLVPV